LNRCLRDLDLGRARDPRVAGTVNGPVNNMLAALLPALVARAGALRPVEQRTAQIAP